MDTALSPAVRLTLDSALTQWRLWSPGPASAPEPVAMLSSGRCNTSIKVGCDNLHWVIRIDGVEPARLGLRRDIEWALLHQAAEAGLAPRPVYADAALGLLVCEYHRPDSFPDTATEIEHTASLLRKIHDLPAVAYCLDPLQRATQYLATAGRESLPANLLDACERVSAEDVKPVLCHNDLLHSNRLYSNGRLLALDWEYAAMGDPHFDLAAVIEGDAMPAEAAEQLHKAWLGRKPTRRQRAILEDNRIIYRELAALWETAYKALPTSV